MPSDLATRATQKAVARQDPNAATLQNALQAMQTQFQMAMPTGMEATRLVRDAMTCIRNTPELARCDQLSVIGAFMSAAQLGLRPGVLGQAWVLPYWDKRSGGHRAQLIVGYQGLIELAYRTGQIASISPRIVYQNDAYVVEYGLDERIVHKPCLDGPRGPVVAYYCVIRTSSGGVIFEHMSVPDAETHRDRFAPRAKAGNVVGPWGSDFDAMALKTVVKKALRWAPKTTELAQALAADGAVRINADLTGLEDLTGDTYEDRGVVLTDDGEHVDTATGEVTDGGAA